MFCVNLINKYIILKLKKSFLSMTPSCYSSTNSRFFFSPFFFLSHSWGILINPPWNIFFRRRCPQKSRVSGELLHLKVQPKNTYFETFLCKIALIDHYLAELLYILIVPYNTSSLSPERCNVIQSLVFEHIISFKIELISRLIPIQATKSSSE